jgi:hypothetical protein
MYKNPEQEGFAGFWMRLQTLLANAIVENLAPLGFNKTILKEILENNPYESRPGPEAREYNEKIKSLKSFYDALGASDLSGLTDAQKGTMKAAFNQFTMGADSSLQTRAVVNTFWSTVLQAIVKKKKKVGGTRKAKSSKRKTLKAENKTDAKVGGNPPFSVSTEAKHTPHQITWFVLKTKSDNPKSIVNVKNVAFAYILVLSVLVVANPLSAPIGGAVTSVITAIKSVLPTAPPVQQGIAQALPVIQEGVGVLAQAGSPEAISAALNASSNASQIITEAAVTVAQNGTSTSSWALIPMAASFVSTLWSYMSSIPGIPGAVLGWLGGNIGYFTAVLSAYFSTKSIYNRVTDSGSDFIRDLHRGIFNDVLGSYFALQNAEDNINLVNFTFAMTFGDDTLNFDKSLTKSTDTLVEKFPDIYEVLYAEAKRRKIKPWWQQIDEDSYLIYDSDGYINAKRLIVEEKDEPDYSKYLCFYMDSSFIASAIKEYPSTYNTVTGGQLEAYNKDRIAFLEQLAAKKESGKKS